MILILIMVQRPSNKDPPLNFVEKFSISEIFINVLSGLGFFVGHPGYNFIVCSVLKVGY